VVKWRDNDLVPCDSGGDEPDWGNDRPLDGLPTNNRLVIYELPTRCRIETDGTVRIAGGTFRDALERRGTERFRGGFRRHGASDT
jgi:hypothetical protein